MDQIYIYMINDDKYFNSHSAILVLVIHMISPLRQLKPFCSLTCTYIVYPIGLKLIIPSLYGIFHMAKMHIFSASQRIFFLYVWFGSWQICCTKSNIFEGSIIESSFSQIPKMVLQFGKNKQSLLKITAYKNYFQIRIVT